MSGWKKTLKVQFVDVFVRDDEYVVFLAPSKVSAFQLTAK
jgi:hypothetical protein